MGMARWLQRGKRFRLHNEVNDPGRRQVEQGRELPNDEADQTDRARDVLRSLAEPVRNLTLADRESLSQSDAARIGISRSGARDD